MALFRRWRIPLVIALSVASMVIAGSFLGFFQFLEGAVRDTFFQLRPTAAMEEAVVVVSIDEPDIKRIGDWPLPDRVFAELIEKLRAQQPRAIGLDIYRDLPEEPGREQLLEVFRTTPNLIGVESILGDRVGPPPVLAEAGQVALANVMLDRDRKLRRGLISAQDHQDGGKVKLTLAAHTALMYLEAEGVKLEVVDAQQQKLKLGRAIFTPLQGGEAGYGSQDDLGGYQILMNWWGPQSSFSILTLSEVLDGEFAPEQVRDRIVLIGSFADSTNDFFETPYSNTGQPMPGVVVHANLASQMIRSALDGRPLLRGLTRIGEGIWIIWWSAIGATGAWALERARNKPRKFLALRTAIGSFAAGGLLVGIAYLSFLAGTLLPVVPPLLAFSASAIVATNQYKQWQLETTNAKLAVANQQLEGYSRTLELKVEERTAELAESNCQLAKAKEAADLANAAKSEFLSNMSHELRTPLNGVLGYAQILQKSNPLSPQQRKGIETIYQCGSHLLTLINDLLDLSKIEARKLELNPTDFHLSPFLSGVAEICSIKAEQKGITFVLNQSENLPLSIHADQKRLRQVLLNLLGNAIKFTDRGRVTLSVSTIGNSTLPPSPRTILRFQIQDTGIGMTAEQLEKIFLPFEQVGEISRKAEGTGLGLAISQKIVNLMGAQLQVQSEWGQGSCFTFDLEVPRVDSGVWQPETTAKRKIVGFSGPQRTIAIVDDRAENRTILVALLKPLGFKTIEASNGREGLDCIQRSQPDLIVTNLIMPVMDGLEMMRQLRQNPCYQDLPILVSSASVFEGDRQKSWKAGSNGFLPKPVVMDDLLDLLEKHLQLEWIYESEEESDRPPQPPVVETEMIYPHPEELEKLLHLAMMGHLKGIDEAIAGLQERDRKFSAFAARVRELVEGFQIRKIREFLQSCVVEQKR